MNRAEVLLVGLGMLVGASGAAFAGTPACETAVARYDAEFKDRSDEKALEATRALEQSCAKPDADRARALSRRAIVHFLRRDLDAAIAGFAEAARLNPDNPTLRMSLCGVYTEAKRFDEAIETCQAGLTLAKAQDDGTPKLHAKVVDLGFNLALAKVRRPSSACGDPTIFALFGFALYKKSCALGQAAACEQVAYTESCRCKTRQGKSP